ncbi:MAG: DUF5778 family protein [Haloferacaceae archaeon]
MSDAIDDDLYERTRAFLEPGDVDLMGAIVHTTLTSDEELELHELQVTLNDVVAAHAGKGEAYIYAGNDDTQFASNQYQGRTLDGDEFVWEAQHLLRSGTFDVVIYYESTADQDAIVTEVEALDDVRRVTSVVLDEA